MKLLLSGTSFTACRRLMEALAERGVDAAIVDATKVREIETTKDVRWIVLGPQNLPYGYKTPKVEFGLIDVDAPLETQVDLVLESLKWTFQ